MKHRGAHVLGPNDGRWLGWLGHRVRYLAIGTETANKYCISDALVRAGDGAPPHRHNFGEGFYVLEGQVATKKGSGLFSGKET